MPSSTASGLGSATSTRSGDPGVDVVDAAGLPDEARALAIVNGMRERRVLIAASGPRNHTLKVRPPLPFDEADADRFVAAFAETLQATRA